jgi:hypothetical protein
MLNKICNSCKLEKPIVDFHKDSSCKFGVKNKCKFCVKEKMSRYYSCNKNTILDKKKILRVESDVLKLRNKSWSENNKQKVKQSQKLWVERNRDTKRENNARRRASRKNALPLWLTREDLELIKIHYVLAKLLSECDGKKYHVDHIVPLQGENVCGLHVPWNLQILTAEENLSKYNKVI